MRDLAAITVHVTSGFHVGDVIRRTREKRKLTQEQLGKAAAAHVVGPRDGPINKSTVVAAEKTPDRSGLGTICRLMATMGLTFSDVERELGHVIPIQGEAGARSKQNSAKHKRAV